MHTNIKYIVGIIAVVLVYQFRSEIYSFVSFPPPPDYAAMHDGKVILYGTSWCGYCTKARKLLESNGVEYFEYDIESSTEGQAQYKTLGGRGIPLLLINGKVIYGYNPKKILKLVKETPA